MIAIGKDFLAELNQLADTIFVESEAIPSKFLDKYLAINHSKLHRTDTVSHKIVYLFQILLANLCRPKSYFPSFQSLR
jgi:hypothetical protein